MVVPPSPTDADPLTLADVAGDVRPRETSERLLIALLVLVVTGLVLTYLYR